MEEITEANEPRSGPGIKLGAHSPRVLYVGGEDHHLRIPFMLTLRDKGFQAIAAGSCDAAPFVQASIEYHFFSFNRLVGPFADRMAVVALRSLFSRVQPHIVQSFDTKPNVLVPLAARGIHGLQAVRTINGMGWVYSSRAPQALALRVALRFLHRLAARSTAATVFQNRQDQQFFQRHRMVGMGQNVLIPGSGIDINDFERGLDSGPSPAELRKTLNIGDAQLVVTVARLTRQKGISTLLKAAAIVHRTRPNVRFLLVGPRQSEGRLAVSQAEIDHHAPYVLSIGQRSDVPTLLRLADVFAFPTEYREGIPRALLEAGLAGLPIVTTNLPGCSDVVRDGYNGLLVPPRAPAILASRILSLLADRQTAVAMGQRAASLVRAKFGLSLVATDYSSLYSSLITSRIRAA